eukprot:723536-Prorocentrum_minimum.AAC.1
MRMGLWGVVSTLAVIGTGGPVERLTATNTLTQKLQSALEESNMKIGKLFMQVVELEGRDLPISIKKLPTQ